jgi:hypothetical protein
LGQALRNHRNETIDSDLKMRVVRDLIGFKEEYSKHWYDEDDVISEIEIDVESALEIFDDDPRFEGDLSRGHDLLLKALLRYMIGKFTMESLDHALELYEGLMERERAHQKHD